MSATPSHPRDVWASGDAYEPYVGRWSRLVAAEFLTWLGAPARASWLDVGCGTGALSDTIARTQEPRSVVGVDRSPEYVAYAQAHCRDPRLRFEAGDAQELPVETAACDVAVSGLVLNFIPDPRRAVQEMARAVRPGGIVSAYVWDYAGRMQLMRHFWNAAAALDSGARDLDEGRRFPLCDPERLKPLFAEAGLSRVEARAVDVWTEFRDFDDFWLPFTGGQGPAPSYLMSLSDERRTALRDRIRASLPVAVDGTIPLVARAWAVRAER